MLGFVPLCVFIEGLSSHRYIITFSFKRSKYLSLSHAVWLHLKTSRALGSNHCRRVARCAATTFAPSLVQFSGPLTTVSTPHQLTQLDDLCLYCFTAVKYATRRHLVPFCCLLSSAIEIHAHSQFSNRYCSKTCLKRNAIVPVFFFPFSQVSVLQRVVF